MRERKLSMVDLKEKHNDQKGRPQRGYRVPFRNHPPEVQKAAKVHFEKLMTKHGHKIKEKADAGNLAGSRLYYGCLIAVATRMALTELGLAPNIKDFGRKGLYKKRTITNVKVRLGLIEKAKDSKQPISAKEYPVKGEVHQGNLDGI